MPAVFSHTGQIHESIKRLITEQIRHKLKVKTLSEGETKQSREYREVDYEKLQ